MSFGVATEVTPSPRRWWIWAGITAAWLVWGVVNSTRMMLLLGHDYDWATAFWYGMPDAFIWAAFTPVVVALTRRSLPPVSWPRTIALHVAAAVVFSLAHVFLDTSVAAVRHALSGESPAFALVFRKLLVHNSLFNLMVYFVISGFAAYHEYWGRLRRREQTNVELQHQLTQARMTSLQQQLRPHFLFNSLNTVSALMSTDPELGQRVIRRLGDLLRASFKSDDRHLIPLAEELELARSYLEVERARFGDRLSVEVRQGDDTQACRVPALVLQPIVENAVRHGISKRVGKGRVCIEVATDGAGLLLQVEDDGPGLDTQAVEASQGIGLANTRRRLQTLYGAESWLTIEPAEPRGTRVTIRLPRRQRSAA